MAKNTQALAQGRRRQNVQVRRWFSETRSELRKVTWPTPEQTRNLTLVVLAVCIVMAAFLGIVDYVLTQLVRLILGY
jgi:preprotein translocase subunit SecE